MKINIILKTAVVLLLSLMECSCSSENVPSTPNNSGNLPKPNKEQYVLAYVVAQREIMPDPHIVTHINYAFAEVNSTFDGLRINNIPRFKKIIALKEQNPKLKICLAIGGWGSGGFSEMASTAATRSAFAKDCKRIIDEYGIDGIDLDWEYPSRGFAGISSSPADVDNFTLLMKEIRKEIGKNNILSFASSASAECFDMKELNKYVDYVSVMTYDMDVPPRHHSALYKSDYTGEFWCDKGIELHHSAGMPYNKIMLGIPFYGHGDESTVSGFIDYKDLERTIQEKKLNKRYDEAAQVPYLTNADNEFVCTYENTKSILEKCKYAKKRKLRGVMYWSYGADDERGTLREAVYRGMKGIK